MNLPMTSGRLVIPLNNIYYCPWSNERWIMNKTLWRIESIMWKKKKLVSIFSQHRLFSTLSYTRTVYFFDYLVHAHASVCTCTRDFFIYIYIESFNSIRLTIETRINWNNVGNRYEKSSKRRVFVFFFFFFNFTTDKRRCTSFYHNTIDIFLCDFLINRTLIIWSVRSVGVSVSTFFKFSPGSRDVYRARVVSKNSTRNRKNMGFRYCLYGMNAM